MKYLKVSLDQQEDPAKIQHLLQLIKGIASVEIIDDENPESELKKAFIKSKEQLKKGEYETIVSDIFDILISPNRSNVHILNSIKFCI